MSRPLLHILLVEDDEIDVECFLRCLKSQRSRLAVSVAHNAVEAFDLLRGGQNRSPLASPLVILLDLNLPGINGFEFLHKLRSDASLKRSIVFVLSASARSQDRKRAYEYNVAGYLHKTQVASDCASLIRLLEVYAENVEFTAVSPSSG